MEYRIVSADDHIDMPWLPKDLWQQRVPAQWRERAPQSRGHARTGPYWICGDDRWDAWGGRKGAAGAMGGRRLGAGAGGVLEPGCCARPRPRCAWRTWPATASMPP